MLQPQTDKIDIDNAKTKDRKKNESRINELKEKLRILVETPMVLNGDLLDNNLFIEPYEKDSIIKGAKILQLHKR